MITGSYDLNTVEEAFDVALKIDLTFRRLVNVKAQCSKCEGYGHCDYHCLSESQRVRTVPSDDAEDLKVVEDVHVSSKTGSLIEDISVGFDTLIIDVIHMSSESTSDDVDEIVEPNTPSMLSKLFEFPYADVVLWSF